MASQIDDVTGRICMNLRHESDRPDFRRADIDQVRKLFIMPDSPDKFLEFGYELLDLIHSFFQEKEGIHSSISLHELGKLFSDAEFPREPRLLSDVLQEIKNRIIAHSVKVGNPYYIGHMTSAIPYFMILLEMIIAALNQNQVKIESAKASTYVERELIAWMHRFVYNRKKRFYETTIQNRDVSLGNVTMDGTMANMTALLVARNKAFPARGTFPGVRRAGVAEALRHYGYHRAVIIVSRRGHYSIDKVARVIGIGDTNVLRIPVDENNRMDINELKRVCENIESENREGQTRTLIMAIVGIAGTTETGNIDNLKEIGRIAKQHRTYFHVDAAWGGGLMLVDEYRYLFNGIQQADSVTVDAHKLLYCPVSMGMVLFRNEKDLQNMRHYSNYIIRPDSVDLGRFTLEGSRSFASLKPWASLKIMGQKGFKLLFDHAFQVTSSLRGLVEVHRNFEAMNQPELFIFNYRFVPEKTGQKLKSLMVAAGDINRPRKTIDTRMMEARSRIYRINEVLNDLNVELHKALREEDTSFVSRTTLDSPKYRYQDIVILRSVCINPLTDSEILREIIDSQNRLGMKIYRAEFSGLLDRL